MTDLEKTEVLFKDLGIRYQLCKDGPIIPQGKIRAGHREYPDCDITLPPDRIGLYLWPNDRESYNFFSIWQFDIDGKYLSHGFWE